MEEREPIPGTTERDWHANGGALHPSREKHSKNKRGKRKKTTSIPRSFHEEKALLMDASAAIPDSGGMTDEIDLTNLVAFRHKYNSLYKNLVGYPFRFDHVFMYLASRLLRKHPFYYLNSYWDAKKRAVVVLPNINLGFFANMECGSGLTREAVVVPVIKDAQELSFRKLSDATEEKIRRVKAGTLTLDEQHHLTCAFNNTGALGDTSPRSRLWSTRGEEEVIRPTAFMFGLTRVRRRIDGRHFTHLVFTLDHRVADGTIAMKFLQRLVTFFDQQKHPDDFQKLLRDEAEI